MQGSIAQLSDYDPFHFSGGLDGGVKVSGVTILPQPTTKFGTCQVLACQIFATTLVAIFKEFNALCELATIGGKVIICRLFFEQRQFFVNGNQDCNKAVCLMLKRTAISKPHQIKKLSYFQCLAPLKRDVMQDSLGAASENNLVFHLHKNINIERLRK